MSEQQQVDLMISNAPLGGWIVKAEGETIAAFSTISELSGWLETTYRPDTAQVETPPELPRMLQDGTGNVTLLQKIGDHITGGR